MILRYNKRKQIFRFLPEERPGDGRRGGFGKGLEKNMDGGEKKRKYAGEKVPWTED